MLRLPPRSTLFPYTTSSDLRKPARERKLSGNCLSLRDGGIRPHLFRFHWHENRVRLQLRLASHGGGLRSEEHTSELQSLTNLVCRLLLEKKNHKTHIYYLVL